MSSRSSGALSAQWQTTCGAVLVLVAVLLAVVLAFGLAPQAGAQAVNGTGIGQPATAAQIAAENIDVRPDGMGLPPASGMAAGGQVIYSAKCAVCHGDTGREGGGGPVLVDPTPFKPGVTRPTLRHYWPYATTLYDSV